MRSLLLVSNFFKLGVLVIVAVGAELDSDVGWSLNNEVGPLLGTRLGAMLGNTVGEEL